MRLPAYQQLSKEQDAVLNLPLNRSYLVAGPPGTGKTVLALYRAKQVERAGDAAKLLVYSKLLYQYLEDAVRSLRIEATSTTYYSWFFGFYRSLFRTNPPQIAPYVFDWPTILGAINQRPPSPNKKVPHLIIDEAQDMPPEFFLVLRLVSKNLTFFADENQRLMETNSTLDEIRSSGGITTQTQWLRRNYRNTDEVAALARHFYSGLATGIPDPPQRSGPVPSVLHHEKLNDTVEFIARYERNFADRDIGVLTPNNDVRKKLVNRLSGKTKNAVQTYYGGSKGEPPVVDFEKPGVKVVNYQSSKGLEFDTVFLPELQDAYFAPGIPDQRMAFYVLLSRSRGELYLCYSGAGEPPILEMFPRDDTLEWR